MNGEQTTAIVQRYLDALAGDVPAEPIIRALLDGSVSRLRLLCTNLLYRGYPRLMRPPLNLEPDELLGAVVERLLKALRGTRPRTVREFFALANQHMRWELNDLARHLDEQPGMVELHEGLAPAPLQQRLRCELGGPPHPGGDRRPAGGGTRGVKPSPDPGIDP